MAEHNRLGAWGEEVVCNYLVCEGFAIVERNWRLEHLEIDIVAEKDGWIAFVEVKTRRCRGEKVSDIMTERKISRLVRAANGFMMCRNVDLKPRFDVAFVYGSPHDFSIDYIADAFMPKLRTYR